MEWLTELITTMHWGAVAQIIMITRRYGMVDRADYNDALGCRGSDHHD